MSFQQFLLILKARWLVIVAVFVLTVASITTISLLMPKQFSATSTVVVDIKSPDLLTGMATNAMMSNSIMATQLDIVRSPRVAKEVVRMLKLEESPESVARWRDATDGKGVLVDWLANSLQRNLEVLPSRESNVINITFTAASPEFAAAVANAYAQAYARVNVNLRVGPARQYADFFEQQGEAARVRLEKAQRELSEYQKANGITSLDDRMDVETAKLNDLSAQLTAVQAISAESRSKRANGRQDVLVDVMQNSLVQSLKADVARTEAKLSEAASRFGSAHPAVSSLEAELSTLRSRLDAEMRRVSASVSTSDDINRQREAQIQAALAAQKTRVLQLNRDRDQLNVLRRNVDSAQRAYDVVLARADQTGIESQVNQANIVLLNAASVPATHSKPRVFINVLVSVFLGVVLGVGIGFIIELLNRRVRCADDLSDVLEMPVLGQVTSATQLIQNIPQNQLKLAAS